EARLFDSGRALGARTNMGLQGTYPEAHLVIEEEVDLVWKQVSVDHGVSELTTAVGVHWFQAFPGWFGGCVNGVRPVTFRPRATVRAPAEARGGRDGCRSSRFPTADRVSRRSPRTIGPRRAEA